MRFLHLAAVLLIVPLAARAEAVRVERVDIVDTGIYAVETGESVPDPNAPAGAVAAPVNATNLEAITEIAGRVGLEFGLRYVIVGEPDGAGVTVDYVIGYPPPGLPDPASPAPIIESRLSRDKEIGETVYLGYAFENDWEIVPGEWAFEIWFEGRNLARQSFTVSDGGN